VKFFAWFIRRSKGGRSRRDSGLTERARRAFFEPGFGGGLTPNKPEGDGHFGTKCSHLPLLAKTVISVMDTLCFSRKIANSS
jgi:hypothetical protein